MAAVTQGPVTPRRGYPRWFYTRHGTWNAERILAAMKAWASETGSPPRSWEWCPGSARNAGLMSDRESKWEREHPRWPGNTTVYRYFRSWGEALEAADLKPFVRHEHDLPLDERVARAQAMSAAGASISEIMAEIGVSRVTVYGYLKAHHCAQCTGFVVRGSDLCRRCATRRGNPKRWSATELLDAVAAWEEARGATANQRCLATGQ